MKFKTQIGNIYYNILFYYNMMVRFIIIKQIFQLEYYKREIIDIAVFLKVNNSINYCHRGVLGVKKYFIPIRVSIVY